MKINMKFILITGLMFMSLSMQAQTVLNELLIAPEGTEQTDVVANTKVTINGAVHISPVGVDPEPISTDHDVLLYVQGKIASPDFVITNPANWNLEQPDYVFEQDYELRSVMELEHFVKTEHHLPDVPSAAVVSEQNHYKLNEMVMGQLKNLEELLLHTIAQDKKIKAQEATIQAQEVRLQKLELLINEN